MRDAVVVGPQDIRAWLRDRIGAIKNCDPGTVDPCRSLTSLGVDSIAALTLVAELEAWLGRQISPDLLIDHDTIDALAAALDDASSLPASSVEPPVKEAWLSSLGARVRGLRSLGPLPYEPVLSEVDGAWAVVDGQRLLMLSSYSYLGLLGHPAVAHASVAATTRLGSGTHGVRLLGGTTGAHRLLEVRLAEFFEAADAVTFSSGYVTNVATISALVGRGDVVIGDALNHASIVDGCRHSGAQFVVLPHRDLPALEAALQRSAQKRTLVAVDAVFSMDGTVADLPEISALCRRHGALLMVDEAHSLGVLGATGRGITEHFNMPANAIDVRMGTLSKTIPSIGGFIAGTCELVDALKYNARGWIFSAALPPPSAAAAHTSLDVIDAEPDRVRLLRVNTAAFVNGLRHAGFAVSDHGTPIVPIAMRDETQTFAFAHRCRQLGVLVYPIIPPAVPIDQPRVRTTMTSAHSAADVEFAVHVLTKTASEIGYFD